MSTHIYISTESNALAHSKIIPLDASAIRKDMAGKQENYTTPVRRSRMMGALIVSDIPQVEPRYAEGQTWN